jgi:hypothetical protein
MQTTRARKVGIAKYRDDPLYPRIVRAVDAILANGKVVAHCDVLVGMGLLTAEKLGVWRRGEVPYLERVVAGNLTRLSRLLRILRFHVHDRREAEPADAVPAHEQRVELNARSG